jgi:hypothetical protein
MGRINNINTTRNRMSINNFISIKELIRKREEIGESSALSHRNYYPSEGSKLPAGQFGLPGWQSPSWPPVIISINSAELTVFAFAMKSSKDSFLSDIKVMF